MQLIDHQIRLQLPAYWPRALQPEALNRMDHPTPFLVCDLETVRERYAQPDRGAARGQLLLRGEVQPRARAAEPPSTSSAPASRSPPAASSQMLQKLGVDPERRALQQHRQAGRPRRRVVRGRAVALRLRLRGRALQAGPARPGGGGVRAAAGRRLDQPVPAVAQVRGRGPGGPGPAAAGPQPRAAALRRDLPRRVAVHRPRPPGARPSRPWGGCSAACRATASPWRC